MDHLSMSQSAHFHLRLFAKKTKKGNYYKKLVLSLQGFRTLSSYHIVTCRLLDVSFHYYFWCRIKVHYFKKCSPKRKMECVPRSQSGKHFIVLQTYVVPRVGELLRMTIVDYAWEATHVLPHPVSPTVGNICKCACILYVYCDLYKCEYLFIYVSICMHA